MIAQKWSVIEKTSVQYNYFIFIYIFLFFFSPAVDPFALCSARRQCKQVHIFNISHFVTTFQVYVI